MATNEKSDTKPEEQIMVEANKLKAAIEERNEDELKSMLSSSQLWFYNKPGTFQEFYDSLCNLTRSSQEIELSLIKISDLDFDENKATLSAEIQLIWTNEKTWEEDEISLEMHLGISKSDQKWKIDFLGVTSKREAASTAAASAEISHPPFEIELPPYFEAPSHFWDPPWPYEVYMPIFVWDPKPRPVYIPVTMPRKLIKSFLKK